MYFVASPIAAFGNRLKLKVTLVNWFKWFTACGPMTSFVDVTTRSGTRLAMLPVVVAMVPPPEPLALKLPLGLARSANADLQDWSRGQHCGNSRNGSERLLQSQNDFVDGRTLTARF